MNLWLNDFNYTLELNEHKNQWYQNETKSNNQIYKYDE